MVLVLVSDFEVKTPSIMLKTMDVRRAGFLILFLTGYFKKLTGPNFLLPAQYEKK